MASYSLIPKFITDIPQFMVRVGVMLNELRIGKINTTSTFTLNANQTSTTITDVRVGKETKIFLTPLTANAAATIATVYIAAANITDGSFVVTHANNANTDKTFMYVLLG